jgi:hypothetical protein
VTLPSVVCCVDTAADIEPSTELETRTERYWLHANPTGIFCRGDVVADEVRRD